MMRFVPQMVVACTVKDAERDGFPVDPGSRPRPCHRCGEMCLLAPKSLVVIAAFGCRVVCSGCQDVPDQIVLVRQEDFWEEVRRAQRTRNRRLGELARN